VTEGSNRLIDLHIHTNYSDGSFSPEEVVNRAAKIGLEAIAITDHDDVGGVHQAIEYGKEMGVEVVSGVELSTHGGGRDVHILGYFFDYRSEAVQAYIQHFQKERHRRARKIVDRLKKLGLEVSFDFILHKAGEGSIGRPHIASALLEEGHVFSMEEAFRKYLGDGKSAFVPKLKIEPFRAMQLIKEAGGLTFIAHPAVDVNEEYVINLIRLGLDGIETIHPHHWPEAIRKYRHLAKQYNVLECGGSDCHGNINGRKVMIGKVTVPYSFLSRMKERISMLALERS
jgi:predicted metal-dependent phosphoesterase TrpH